MTFWHAGPSGYNWHCGEQQMQFSSSTASATQGRTCTVYTMATVGSVLRCCMLKIVCRRLVLTTLGRTATCMVHAFGGTASYKLNTPLMNSGDYGTIAAVCRRSCSAIPCYVHLQYCTSVALQVCRTSPSFMLSNSFVHSWRIGLFAHRKYYA